MKNHSARIISLLLAVMLLSTLFVFPADARVPAGTTAPDTVRIITPDQRPITRLHYGDANGDDAVSAADLLLLRRYLASLDSALGTSPVTVSGGADSDGSCTVNAADLTLLRSYLANLNYATGISTVELGTLAPLKVLFLGNSLTYYNDMPYIFRDLAAAAGKSVYVDDVTKGSATVAQFADAATDIGAEAQELLTTEYWDYVVIEPSRRITPEEDTIKTAEINASLFIQELAEDAGAELLLYSVWGNNDGEMKVYEMTGVSTSQTLYSLPITHQEHTAIMHDEVLDVAEALGGVRIVEAGYAFENQIAAESGAVNIYHTDNRHPNERGSYLVACAFFDAIFGERCAQISFTNGLDASVAALLRITADATVIDGIVPDLSAPEEPEDTFNLLIIGSEKMNNYAMGAGLSSLTEELDGFAVNTTYVMDSSYTNTQIVDASNDLGMRAALESAEWDAIIIQISRRNTISATAVAESEKAALAEVLPLLKAKTSNIYLFALESDATPTIFKISGTAVNYVTTNTKETYSAAEGTAFFNGLAEAWVEEFDLAGAIEYGNAYLQIKSATGRKQTKQDLQYLQPCILYMALFGKTVPAGTALESTYAASATVASQLRSLVPLAFAITE